MATRDSSSKMLTYRDYLRFPEDGSRHEVLDGSHCVTPPPVVDHQGISGNLYLALAGFVRERQLGRVYYAPVAVRLSKYDVVEPDLFFISNARLEILDKKSVQGAPDLVIEILSPSTRRRDEVLKRVRYERFGVAEYWLVDPLRQCVRILRRGEADVFQMLDERTAALGHRVSTPLLPGLDTPVAAILA